MTEEIRVLVVEDNADQAFLVQRTLSRHTPPMQVTVVGTASACIEALARTSYSVVLLDHRLPGASGLDVLREIHTRATRVPVVMVTGEGDERVAVEAMKAGAVDYVVKSADYCASLPPVITKAVKQHALTLENARLDREARRRLRETEGLLAVAQTLGASLDRDEIARRTTRELVALLEADTVTFIASGDVEPPADAPARLWAPVSTAERCFGALVAGWREMTRQPTHDERRLAGGVAKQMALALENARLYQEMRDAQERLVEGHTLRALGEMAAGTAHHLNNLLAIALGRLQLLRPKLDTSPTITRPLDIVERALLDAASVVRRMQRFGRTGPVEDQAEPIDLNPLVSEVRELTATQCADSRQALGVSIEVRLECATIPSVVADPAALREVLTNLVLNALDAMPSGGVITLRTLQEGSGVCVVVSDTGNGMTPEVKRRALEPFFTTKGPKGTGLGLSVAYGIMRRFGGDLQVESTVGVGTSVTLRLPTASPLAKRDARPVRRADDTCDAPMDILLVDDDDLVRSVLAETLEAKCHRVVQVSSGRQALALLEDGLRVDLVLTDHGMPEMTGVDLTRAIKERWPGMRIGLVTGWGDSPDGLAGDVAPEFTLAKPVASAVLHDVVGARRPAMGD
jgi:signal transduction histidine kinase